MNNAIKSLLGLCAFCVSSPAVGQETPPVTPVEGVKPIHYQLTERQLKFHYPTVFTIYPDETVDQAMDRYDKVRLEATLAELGFQALNILDAVQTGDCVRRRVCKESNPLMVAIVGKRPSTTDMLLVKVPIGVIHYVIFAKMRKTDPYKARRFAITSVIVQGGIVLINARFSF